MRDGQEGKGAAGRAPERAPEQVAGEAREEAPGEAPEKAPGEAPEEALRRVLAVMARLRDPEGGCPWDREQDFASLVPHTLEEAYEVAEAAEALAAGRGRPEALREELGDLLFQVVFYARLAEERGLFGFAEVARGLAEKLVRRHPHVFGPQGGGGAPPPSREDLQRRWEAQKEAERREASVLDGVPRALPALSRAAKLQRRAARLGFDWPDLAGPLAKVEEELEELRAELAAGGGRARLEHELGDLLFACANLARHLGLDPEQALRRAGERFAARFRRVEAALAGEEGPPPGLARLEALWREAKEAEAGTGAGMEAGMEAGPSPGTGAQRPEQPPEGHPQGARPGTPRKEGG
ncbi:MAG: nucleoside triphosphate pyrophosphohydrolase [Gammaproteobacteria bacterium]|nr:MAG: nucleoside triphosphate pyrophosphohydrolase [Gammaproteobacteria bacterium]